ncbi:MAG: lysophospholipid transporter LplT [Gammaproteobacteria bacterium]|nr:lysophospholipid transporter LplT [Beggiatoa alba]PCH60936.1 MAG: lysophospholipid transporter LplT [Gammaproteobacteria bacterium]
MNDFKKLLIAQFLTAFADNAILFTAITWVFANADTQPWYVPALQASFLIAFVVLAPWVGAYADTHAKPKVMVSANLVKIVGAGLMIVSVEPLLAYAVVGIGAAMYSPAKYGILPELVDEQELVKANGWIEGATIIAILAGTIVGAKIANQSLSIALWFVVGLYALSALIATRIGPLEVILLKKSGHVKAFVQMCKTLIENRRARFALIGSALFWASAALLRVALVVWAPIVLLIFDTDKIAELTAFIMLGIILGSVLAAKLFNLEDLRRARFAAYAMGVFVIIFSQVDTMLSTRITLFLIGVAGGMFIVPINAVVQNIGHKTVGAGGTVAVQNFFNNLAMLAASIIYAVTAAWGAPPIETLVVLGVCIILATLVIARQLRQNQE